MLDMCMNTCIILVMKVIWDETKRRSNLRKHSMDFADAEAVFAGATFTFEDDRFDYGEQRFITLGMLKGVVVVIAHTEQDDEIRIISMRKGTKNEQRIYFQGFTN
jgi:uncharacterized DUF497 family protein